jgi:hypothetical protein
MNNDIKVEEKYGGYPGFKTDNLDTNNKKEQKTTLLDNLVIDNLTESDIKNLKTKMREIEKKVREKNKPKTITISGEDHSIIKNYCSSLQLNIGEWASKVLLDEINKHKCILFEDLTSEERMERDVKLIKEKYFTKSNSNLKLFKCNKILFGTIFKFKGYSQVDAKPIYELASGTENSIINDYIEQGVDFEVCDKSEISANIFYNIDLDIM